MSARPIAVVTGGAGFIGSHTVDLLLARGYAVRVIDDFSGGREANLVQHSREPALAFERKDVRGIEPGDPLFRDARYVFHFAGLGDLVPSIERPAEYVSVNVAGTVAVLEAARAAAVDLEASQRCRPARITRSRPSTLTRSANISASAPHSTGSNLRADPGSC